jgi:WD40 repeat protein
MTLSEVQPFLDEAFEFLRDCSFDVSREDWLNFWRDRNIQETELPTAKQALINELANNVIITENEKLQKLEQIFCCDPFDKESVKNLLDVYQERKNVSPSQANIDSYEAIIILHTRLNLSKQNKFFTDILPDLLGLIDRKLQGLYSILVKANNNYNLKDAIIRLFRNLYKKFTGVFTGVRAFLSNHSKKVMFAILTCVTIAIILGLTIRESNRLNQQAEAALNQFNTQEIEGLETALEAANKLNQLVSKKISYSSFLKSLLPLSPINSLQTIINHIHEKNRSETFINQKSIKTISLSSNGKSVALSKGDGSVEIWDSFLLKRELVLLSCNTNITSISFDPTNENILATGGIDGKVCFLNRKTRQSDTLFLEDKKLSEIKSVNFSPNANLLAVTQMDGEVKLINPKSRKVILRSWRPSKGVTFDVSFNNDENKIATASKDGIVQIWNYSSSPTVKELNSWKIDDSPDENPFIKTSFTKDNEFIVITENNNLLNFSKYSKQVLEDQKQNQSKPIPIETISLNGYSSSKQDIDDTKQDIDDTISSVNFDTKSQILITVDSKNLVKFWDLSKKEDLFWTQPTDSPITKISLRNSKKSLTISLLTLDKENNLKAWSIDGHPIKQNKKIIKAKNVSFIPQREDFVTVDTNGAIQFWNINKLETFRPPLKSEQKDTTSIAFNPQGTMIAIGTDLGAIEFFDTTSRQNIGSSPTSGGGAVKFIDFSLDGKFVVGVKSDIIEIFDVSSDLKNLIPKSLTEKIKGQVTSIDINEDGNIALTARKDRKIKLFSSSGKLIKSIEVNNKKTDGINGVSFSQNSELFDRPWIARLPFLNNLIAKRPLIAVVNTGGDIEIWDWLTQNIIAQFQSDLKEINDFIIDSNGKQVFVGGSDGKNGKIQSWKINSLQDLINYSCKWLEDYHTQYPESKSIKYCSKGK